MQTINCWRPSTESLILMIFVNFEIFELLSITTDVAFASKYSPDIVIALDPDFDN